MALIAQNHFQFILEVGAFLFATVFFLLNFIPITLSLVTVLALVACLLFTGLFAMDLLMLFVSFSQSELTHGFGPLALLAMVTALAALKVMKTSGVNTGGLEKLVYIFLAAITIFGALMHRSFLLLWLFGLFIGYFIISSSFREKTVLSLKRIITFLGLGALAFVLLEGISQLIHMPIFSPLTRISRIELNSIPSIKMVLKNTFLIGHSGNSSFWGTEGTAFSEGYITLPVSFVLLFGLPFPIFYGSLITTKDTIDYMLPGIMGYAFDFGYLGFVLLVAFMIFTIVVGFKLLYIYREKRESNNKKYLGREILLIGSLTAFIAQGTVGLFIFNRTINGSALLTFLIISALVLGHMVTLKRN
ncbi:hypothetical protein [Methanobrevibacter curvatus]|uniref:O-antigen ligase n=1 Tax=Methanobrevibacter curvatus TaxID=49547 RepID=A0A166AYY8_9EURY|nr:hypothetical protein [Methanobrevibacter curvatus]KZX12649.1 hypothetical protein MBCUR_09790 [Methanobrevibacter curvatus]